MFNSLYFNRSHSQVKNLYYPIKSEGSIQCKDGSFDFSEKDKDVFPNIISKKKITMQKNNIQELVNIGTSTSSSKEKSRANMASSYAKVSESLTNIPKKVIFSKLNLEGINIKENSLSTDPTLNTLMSSMRSFMFTSREKFIKENKKHISFFKSRDRSPPLQQNLKLMTSLNKNKKIKIISKSTQEKNKEKKKIQVHQHPITFPESISTARQRNNRIDMAKLPITSGSRDFKSFFLQINNSLAFNDPSIFNTPSSYSKRGKIREPNFLYKFSDNNYSPIRNGVLYTQAFQINKSKINVNELLNKVNNSESNLEKTKRKLKNVE
jgi:hypothetical protein